MNTSKCESGPDGAKKVKEEGESRGRPRVIMIIISVGIENKIEKWMKSWLKIEK